jgi:hypothetical protein
MRRPARWECDHCRRLIGEIEDGVLRLARAVETAYVVSGGLAIACPGCERPRVWYWEAPSAMTTTGGT